MKERNKINRGNKPYLYPSTHGGVKRCHVPKGHVMECGLQVGRSQAVARRIHSFVPLMSSHSSYVAIALTRGKHTPFPNRNAKPHPVIQRHQSVRTPEYTII